ncbi:DUF4169 family protein [Rhodospirillum centenum]|uniref:Uncharacterized protein n=1 Tax=Rhodospirillum centenum (strain ATCC 51521 / SW) TaxID=414684 RepID=B6INR0_RHOCS|nr:DUF4169 family protein [Rhodospirillum centenum]ACI99244.1 conserved hypothetical protein [Rhodospirillum centenum SW]
MGEVVNLNRYRKQRSRAEREKEAAANRAKHGRTKAERHQQAMQQSKDTADLEQHRLDRDE